MQVTNHMSAMESVLLKLRTIATFKSAGAKKIDDDNNYNLTQQTKNKPKDNNEQI